MYNRCVSILNQLPKGYKIIKLNHYKKYVQLPWDVPVKFREIECAETDKAVLLKAISFAILEEHVSLCN